MVKNHLKTVAVPRSWPVQRKATTFTTRPNPGAHPHTLGISLRTLFIEILGLAKTAREVRYILRNQEVLIDGRRTKESHFCVGLFDVISLPRIKKQYRVVLSSRAKLSAIEESGKVVKPVRIMGKRLIKGKFQLSCTGGRAILMDKNQYAVGDSVLVELPIQKIVEHYPLAKGSFVYLTGGKNMGKSGQLQSIDGDGVLVQLGNQESVRTAERYVIAIGKEKAAITIQ